MQKYLLCLLLATVYTASAVPLAVENTEDFEYPQYIEFPDGEGNMHSVDLMAEPDMELLSNMDRNPDNNRYFLFTRRNPTTAQELIFEDHQSIKKSHFNGAKPTVVVVHGWLSNQNSGLNPAIRDAYLDKAETNVIIVDWRRLALNDYVTAARGVPAVGRGLGQFLAFLHSKTGQSYSKMHLVGFSLGAHVVGNAGRELGGKVSRITALDPAGPLWKYSSNKVSPTDGIYVEAIHTDGGYTVGGLGIGSNVADADFYPNGGISQPGCITNVCNHNRAWEFFAASVTYDHFVGRECTSSLQITTNRCRGGEFNMGNDDLKKRGSGMYRLDTKRRYPF